MQSQSQSQSRSGLRVIAPMGAKLCVVRPACWLQFVG
jgi:hypothetical protein